MAPALLYAPIPKTGNNVVLDFNQAHNLPARSQPSRHAAAAKTECDDRSVEAGEKNYGHH